MRINKLKNTLKVSDVAYRLLDLTSQVGLIENYLECLAMGKQLGGEYYVSHSLFDSHGLSNITETLAKIRIEIQKASDLLCETDVFIVEESDKK